MPQEKTLPELLQNRDRQRLRAYADNLDFYRGQQWTGANPRNQRRLTYNYTRAVLDKVTAYLMTGRSPAVEPADSNRPALDAAAEAETAILQVWDQNNAEALDFDTELDAAVLGDGAYKVTWDPDTNQVRLSPPDPAGIFAWHWPDDPARIWRVAQRYDLETDSIKTVIPDAANLDPTATQTIVEDWTAETFHLWINNAHHRQETNPYGFIPYVLFPNIREPKQIWGTSDIEAIREPQRELNRALTQLSKIMELSGNPVTILENVNEAQDIAVEPGAVWELPQDAKAYLLDLLKGGGFRAHLDYIDTLFRTIHDLGETPRSAFGGAGSNLSGVALELELDPIVKKVQRKRLIRTAAYRQRNDMILALLDRFAHTNFGHVNNDIAWGTVLPTDRDREVANEVALVGAAVHSRRHAADTLGEVDDPDAEFGRWLAEQAQLPKPPTTQP
jgi:hypothetical protein